MGARGANKSGPWCIPRGLLQSFARPQGEGGPNRVNQPGLFRPDIDHIILVIKFAHLAQELLKLPTAILTHFAFNSASASSTVFGLASECLTSASSRIRVSVSCSLLERQTPSSETNSTKTTLIHRHGGVLDEQLASQATRRTTIDIEELQQLEPRRDDAVFKVSR